MNCSAGSEARFRVLAEDHGHPRLSATADVQVDLIDSEAPSPIFDKPLYEVQVREDAEIGECLVQVSGMKISFISKKISHMQLVEQEVDKNLSY